MLLQLGTLFNKHLQLQDSIKLIVAFKGKAEEVAFLVNVIQYNVMPCSAPVQWDAGEAGGGLGSRHLLPAQGGLPGVPRSHGGRILQVPTAYNF